MVRPRLLPLVCQPRHQEAGERRRRQAAALWLARQVPDHPALPAIIAARLAGVPGLDVTRLASPTVLAALGPGQADLALQVTAAGLRRPAGSLAALRLVSAA